MVCECTCINTHSTSATDNTDAQCGSGTQATDQSNQRPDGGITVYYPEDDEHEEISLPEPTIVFSTQPDSYVTVTRDMLPSV